MGKGTRITLKELREKSGHTREEAAEYINRSETTIRNWEKEDNTRISSLPDLHDLLEFYGADKQTVVDYIWERYGDPAIDPDRVRYVEPDSSLSEAQVRICQILTGLLKEICQKKAELMEIMGESKEQN